MIKITKYLTYCLILAITLSCSNSDDTANLSTINFNPPSWIQGIWFEENSLSGYKFTSDDIISLTLDEDNNIIREGSRKSAFSNFVDGSPSVKESDSDSFYSATVMLNGQDREFYEFVKTSENSMSAGSSLTYNKQ